ncbi:hypothetical protein [Ruegeria sp. HKCCA4812]|uniref:plasmid mobilization protein n=1 Tax=Ruegeria sp. HKCCA4812 TaxID=2682993 RepID=UPI001488EAEA|nr:hypothetical protein [Ruegeria sp. HKCCA4812]
MTTSGSEKRKRTSTLTMRLTDSEAALIKACADAAGVSASAYVRHAALHTKPLRKSRTPPLDRQAAAQMLGQMGQLATAFREVADGADQAEIAAVIEAVHRDLAEMRTVLFEALGRQP